jgi:hypothetical protein
LFLFLSFSFRSVIKRIATMDEISKKGQFQSIQPHNRVS